MFRRIALAAGVAAGIGTVLDAASLSAASTRAREAATLVVAARADTGADGAQVTPHMIDAGRTIFHGQGGCFACHGLNMQGSAIAPPLDKKGKPWLAATGGMYAEILRVITRGVPNTAMLARPNGINDDAAKNVAAYVWAVNHGTAKP
ncbi:MAG: cytochrome c [Gemmatimonadaceae bacterium]